MAKDTKDLVETLRARGLRKRVAHSVADAMGSTRKRSQDHVTQVAGDLKQLAEDLEGRVTGRTAKRKAAARKGAKTKARKARARSEAAKKGARTRSRSK